jgi:hypothetical protein
MCRDLAIAVLAAATVLCSGVRAQVRMAPRPAPRPVVSRMGAVGVRTFPAARPGMIPPGRVLAPNRFGQSRFIVASRFRHHRHHFIFTSGCFGPFFDPFLCQRAFFAAPPFWPSPLFGSDVPQAYSAAQQTEAVQYQPDNELRAEIGRLAEEVEMLREQQARNAPQPVPSQAPQRPASTVLVFRDGHRTDVQNYGIVGQTLWIFTEQRARKIPLSDLDMDATQEANAERGVEFLAPGWR